jgi:hypothetical protein
MGSFLSLELSLPSFRDALQGADPESIFCQYSSGAMDSGLARCTRAPE